MTAINFNAAINAYNKATKVGGEGSVGSSGVASSTSGFSGIVNNAVNNSIDSTISNLHKAEGLSAKSLVNKADITDVVTAITSAESTLRTVVAVRDRLVTAHQEIMRMPI